MFVLFVTITIIILLLILFAVMPLTVRLRFVFGPKERSFRWQASFMKNLYHKEFDVIPRDKIEEELHKRGRQRAVLQLQDLLKRSSFWQVDAYVLLGVGDAAYTAVLCGFLDATLNALASRFLPKGKKGRGLLIQTTPSFDTKALEAQIHGIFQIRLVQIMLAALAWRKEQTKERHA